MTIEPMNKVSTLQNIKSNRDAHLNELRTLDETASGREFSSTEAKRAEELRSEISRADNQTDVILRDMAGNQAVNASAFSGGNAEERAAHALASVLPESRALSIGVPSAGGALTHEDFSALQVYFETVPAVSSLARQYASNDKTLLVPRMEVGATASIVAEAAAIPASDPTFGQVELVAYKQAFKTIYSRELNQDGQKAGNVQQALATEHLRAHARLSDDMAINGTGEGQSLGLIANEDITVTGSLTAALTLDHVLDAQSLLLGRGVDPDSITVVMSAADWSGIISTKTADTYNTYAVGAVNEQFARQLFGMKVVLSPFISGSCVLGDFDYAAQVVRQGAEIAVSDEAEFDTDQLSMRSVVRIGFAVVDPAAFARIDGIV